MGPQKQSSKQRIAILEAENIRLRSEVEKLKNKKLARANRKPFNWRVLLIGLIVAASAALLVTANIIFWASRTVTETDRYVEIVTPLIAQPEVQKAISKKTTDALFAQVNVEDIARNALPERAQFLAPSLAVQVRSFADRQAEALVGSDQFQTIWVQANTTAHQRLLNFIRNYEGDGTIDISDVYTKLSDQLQGTKLSFLAGKQLPPKIGAITVADAPNLPKLHWLVVNLTWLRYSVIFLFICLTSLIVWLSANRRRTIVRLGLVYGGLMLISLLSVRIGREVAIQRVAPEYRGAAMAAWQVIMHPFVVQTTSLLLVGLIMAIIAWLGGTGTTAIAVRRRVKQILNGKLHQAIFDQKENRMTRFLAQYKRLAQGVIIALAFISLLFIRLRPMTILAVGGVMLLLILSVEVLAATRK